MQFTTGVQMSTSAQIAVYVVLCFFSIFTVMSIVSNDHLQALSIVWLRCLTGMNHWLTVQNLGGEQTVKV